MCNPFAGKKKEPTWDDDGFPKPGMLSKIKSMRLCLLFFILQAFYTLFLGARAYLSIGNTPFEQYAQQMSSTCEKHHWSYLPQYIMPPQCQPGLYGPALERLDYPPGFGAIASYDAWAKYKKDDEQWMYAFFMGRSALRACSSETNPDTWAKSIGLVGDYAANADFDGNYAAYSACKKKDLVGSCNIKCNSVKTECANNCEKLFNTTEDGEKAPTRNGWLWDYVLKDGGGGSPKQYECQGTALPTPSPSGMGNTSSRRLLSSFEPGLKPRSRLLNSSTNNSNAPSPSRESTPSISPAPGVVPCPESKHTSKNCTCPAGQTNTEIQRSNDPRDFVSDPDGDDYNKACSFNFTRMVTPYVNEKENKKYVFNGTVCHGKAVYSIAYTNDIVRYILIGGVAFKMFSIVLLYIAACSTPKNENRRDNLKLSLCLATPGGCWYVCECNKCRTGEKGKGKEIVKETLKNAAYRPEVTGCLAFTSLLGDIGLTMGLFIMCLGVSPIDSAPQWSGVFLGLGSVLNNIRGNLKTKYKAKQKLYVLCPVPWPTYVEPYPGAKYGMPKPDENGKFFWEEGYIKPPLLPCMAKKEEEDNDVEMAPTQNTGGEKNVRNPSFGVGDKPT